MAERYASDKRLIETWGLIVAMLEKHIVGSMKFLSPPPVESKRYEMKAFEDMLDAVICAWVGTCILDKNAIAYGGPGSAPAGRAGFAFQRLDLADRLSVALPASS